MIPSAQELTPTSDKPHKNPKAFVQLRQLSEEESHRIGKHLCNAYI